MALVSRRLCLAPRPACGVSARVPCPAAAWLPPRSARSRVATTCCDARSWKVYDLLFALLILYLGKRIKLIQRARELELI